MGKVKIKPNYRRQLLRLPDPDHCKLPVPNSLGSPASRRVYKYAIQRRKEVDRKYNYRHSQLTQSFG